MEEVLMSHLKKTFFIVFEGLSFGEKKDKSTSFNSGSSYLSIFSQGK